MKPMRIVLSVLTGASEHRTRSIAMRGIYGVLTYPMPMPRLKRLRPRFAHDEIGSISTEPRFAIYPACVYVAFSSLLFSAI